MAFITKLDLTKQARIDLNTIALFDGSMSIGQQFFISGIEIDPKNPVNEFVLTYDVLTNSFKPAQQFGSGIPENRPFYGMAVSAITNLTYFVSEGIYKIDDQFYNFTGSTITLNSGDSTYDRFDVIYVTGVPDSNQLYALQGTPANPPIIPTVTGSSAVIAIIRIPAQTTAISGTTNIYYTTLINASQVQYTRGIYNTLNQYLDGNYIRPKIYSFTNNLNELTFGQTATTITFDWETNKTGYNYTLNPPPDIYNNNTFTSTLTGQVITGDASNSATTFTLTFDDGITTTQATTDVKFYNKRYIGSTSGLTASTSTVYGFQFKEFAYNDKMSIKKVDNAEGNYVYIYEPAIGDLYQNVDEWYNPGSAPGQLNNPFGVAIDSNDRVYITDSFNSRIQVFDEFGNFLFKFGSNGTGDGQLSIQTGNLAVDLNGRIYVCDTFNNRIQVFDSTGGFLFKFGSGGGGPNQFNNPYGITILRNSGNILIADTYNSRLQLFDPLGNFISIIGTGGSGDNEYSLPIGVTSDNNDNIYVADLGNSRIQVLNSGGTYQYQFGTPGSGDGELNQPFGLALDNINNVYVLDNNNNRVQVFDVNGNYLFQFPTPYTIGSSAGIGLTISFNDSYKIYLIDRSGSARVFKYSLVDGDVFVNGLYSNDFIKKIMNFTNEYGYTTQYIEYRTTNRIYDNKLFVEFR